MNSFFKVPTDGRFTQYKLNPSQLLVACWMSNLIQLNFSQLSYSYIKVGLNTQCGIELDVRTIRSIVTSLVNKGIFTRSKKSNFYIYNIVDQNVPKNIQNDPLQNDPLQNDPLQNDPLNKDQNVPLGIQKDPYQVDQNVPKNIQNDPSINKNNKEIEETEEETPSPSFSYSTQYQKESRKESSDKFYKDAFQKYPRELVRAHEVSQCIDEMCECYELNAKEFERSKSNFKQTVRNRAEKIVKVLLDDKSDFAPMEVFWGIKLYETSSTSEPTPAGIKKSCIKCRIERNNYTDKLKYVLNLRSDDLNVPEDDFLLTSFVNRFGSELEGLENARYSESKDYDVKFNDLVLKMAELPVQDNIPDYWTMYRNQSGALPINLDIRQIA